MTTATAMELLSKYDLKPAQPSWSVQLDIDWDPYAELAGPCCEQKTPPTTAFDLAVLGLEFLHEEIEGASDIQFSHVIDVDRDGNDCVSASFRFPDDSLHTCQIAFVDGS